MKIFVNHCELSNIGMTNIIGLVQQHAVIEKEDQK